MKLVAMMSTAVLTLLPVVSLAEDPKPGSGASGEPGVIDKVIGTITGRSPAKEDADAKGGEPNLEAKSGGDTNYPDMGAVKRTDR
jgi:hypothetical protein